MSGDQNTFQHLTVRTAEDEVVFDLETDEAKALHVILEHRIRCHVREPERVPLRQRIAVVRRRSR